MISPLMGAKKPGLGGSMIGAVTSNGRQNVASALGVVVIILLTVLVVYQHESLEHRLESRRTQMRLHTEMLDKDWDKVFDLAQKSIDANSFVSNLKVEGLVANDGDKSDRPQQHSGLDPQEATSSDAAASPATGNNDNLHHFHATINVHQDYSEREAFEDDYEEVFGEGLEAGDVYSYPDVDETDPVNGKPPPLSENLARRYSVNNTVIVTWANFALWDFVKSWVWHMKQIGLTNFLVGAMDQQIGGALVAAGIPSFAMYSANQTHSGVGSDHLSWGGDGFSKMGRQKISLAKMFLEKKINLLLVDADVVILRDVMQYFNRFPEADILVSTDLLSTPLAPGDDGLEKDGGGGAPMNIGIMFFRHNDNTTAFVNRWLQEISDDPKLWDQNAFNELARAGWDPVLKVHPNNSRIYIGFNGSLAVGVLPTASFTGGHTFFIQKLYEVQKVDPYAVHATFQYGGNMGKRNRMREAMLFYDEMNYYTGDNYIQIDVTHTPDMSPQDFQQLNYSEMKAYNEKGIHMQLQSIWPGIALSVLFNRSIIVPKIGCYCDRYWMRLERCQIPGASKERLPFVCPMDYILQPDLLADNESSIAIRWRESSFLENPRCPQSVRASKLTIYTDKTVNTIQEKWRAQDGGLVLIIPSGLNSSALKAIMDNKNYTDKKVWHFKSPEDAFSKFDTEEMYVAFERRKAHLNPIFQPDMAADGSPM